MAALLFHLRMMRGVTCVARLVPRVRLGIHLGETIWFGCLDPVTHEADVARVGPGRLEAAGILRMLAQRAVAGFAADRCVPAAFAGGGNAPPPFPILAGFAHAEINVRIRKEPHTLILDLGRIVSVSPTEIVLVESDGSTWTVPISPATLITLNGRPALASELHRRLVVETMRIDGGAAVRVRAVGLRF